MTQALNCAAAGEGAAVNNKAQGISQNRILRHSFLRAPDWTIDCASYLIVPDFGFDFPGLSTVSTVQQARSGHIQPLKLSHRAVTCGSSANLPQPRPQLKD